jgi:hypothetical protein
MRVLIGKDSVSGQPYWNSLGRFFLQNELTERCLDGYLPGTCGGKEYLISPNWTASRASSLRCSGAEIHHSQQWRVEIVIDLDGAKFAARHARCALNIT